ncbi:hypothetical protein SJV74_20340, partial [Aeromonas caviae]|nr:hypothetical protein [Aeromonas caviae]
YRLAIGPLPTGVVVGRGQGVLREDRLSHPGRTDAVIPVLVNRYPLALVGAGGMALFAVFFTDFKSEVCEEFTLFNKKWPHVFTISKRHRALRFESVPFKSAFSRTLYCRVEDIDVILNLIKSHIFIESVKYIKGHPGI